MYIALKQNKILFRKISQEKHLNLLTTISKVNLMFLAKCVEDKPIDLNKISYYDATKFISIKVTEGKAKISNE